MSMNMSLEDDIRALSETAEPRFYELLDNSLPHEIKKVPRLKALITWGRDLLNPAVHDYCERVEIVREHFSEMREPRIPIVRGVLYNLLALVDKMHSGEITEEIAERYRELHNRYEQWYKEIIGDE